MNFIKKYFQKVKRNSQDGLYRRGFAWAMCSYYIDSIGIHEIEQCISYIDRNNFDRGVEFAIVTIAANT